MAIALHVGASARPAVGAASRFGTSRSDVLSGVYAEHYDRLMGFFVRRTRDRLLAEDLTHDTIVRFVRSCDTFDVSRPAWPYLKTTANNVLIDHLRRAERQVDIDVEEKLDEEECLEPTPDSLLVLRETLSEALGQLPDRQRIAVDLRYERGWSVPDAADFLGVSPGTFGQLLFRARQTMKDYLDSVGTGVHGVVLPALLALRGRWRTWSAKGREVAQTPVTAMSMEAFASVMVAASLGAIAIASSGGPNSSHAVPMQATTFTFVDPSESGAFGDPAVLPPAPTREQVQTVEAQPVVVEPTPPQSESIARVGTSDLDADALDGTVAVEEDPARFVVSHEVEVRTGVSVGAAGDTISVDCDFFVLGDIVCADKPTEGR